MESYYAVRKGRKPGIYRKWDECNAQVSGFPNAEFKKFASEWEAEEFLHPKEPESLDMDDDSSCTVYVDGSYNDKFNLYGYGVVMIFPDGNIEEFSGYGNEKDMLPMRNVAGEILGCTMAVNAASALGIKKLLVCHDYTGIRYWATGEWQANKPATKRYKSFMEDAMKNMSIQFGKIKAHTGDRYNEMADALAKRGAKLVS